MSKQDKRLKKERKAAEKAAAILEEAVANLEPKDYGQRPENCTEAEWATACAVRGLREQGEAWWAIAKTLGLPGAGDSASTGKAGAAQARKAYSKGFGAHPRSFTRGQGRTTSREKNETAKAINKITKRERRAQVRSGKHVIDPEMPSEELAEMLKGRKVQWLVKLPDIGEEDPGFEMEAWVHPTYPIYIEGEGAERVIEFREQHKRAPQDVRWMPAHIRTIRMSRIFGVKGER